MLEPTPYFGVRTVRLCIAALFVFLATGLCARLVSAQDDTTHWAFRPLHVPALPDVDHSRIRTAVDRFVAARWDDAAYSFSPDAEPAALVRRVYLDLLGLPPDRQTLETFVQDPSERNYEMLLDRLLASPHFGERWGRHWLDAAGYVDVIGGDNDAGIIKLGENKWRYRDYVIDAINDDVPFDRFVTEQLAGDELIDWRAAEQFTPEMERLLLATGFLRVSADDTGENELNTMDIRYGVLHRTCETVAGNLLALTLQCAKCHDHKYEPITQQDYYSFQALFQPAFNPDHWLQPQQRQLPNVAPQVKAEIDRHNADADRQAAELQQNIDQLRQRYRQQLLESRLLQIPEAIRGDTQQAVQTAAEKRSDIQKYLAEKFGSLLTISDEQLVETMKDDDRAALMQTQQDIEKLKNSKRSWNHWQVVFDVAAPTATRILERGDPFQPFDEVAPAFLRVLDRQQATFEAATDVATGTSGRRLALARWLTHAESSAGALVVRVRVNRIWMHLFGQGLVESVDNFGETGSPPTHPELLEWLAGDFVNKEQRLKPFLKSLLLSTAYRQSSSAQNPAAAHLDPDNRWLWRQRLRRLESEVIRDALLAACGSLDTTIGGPPVSVESRADGSFVIPDSEGRRRYRRSIYLLQRRNYHPTVLSVFDQPNLTTHCTSRQTSAVVLQSLTMLNDALPIEQSQRLAEQLIAQQGDQPTMLVQQAFYRVLSRPPTSEESGWCVDSLAQDRAATAAENTNLPSEEVLQQSLARFCQTLLNTSEFLYTP